MAFVEFPKIHTMFKRTENGVLLIGNYSKPEFDYLRNVPWIAFEKIDGVQARAMFDGKKVRFEGRKSGSALPENVLNILKKRITANAFKKAFDSDCKEVTLYIECYGKGVRETHTNYGLEDIQIALFAVMVHDWWLVRKDVVDVSEKMSIAHAPYVGVFSNLSDMMVAVGAGIKSRIGNGLSEGVVAYPAEDLYFRGGNPVSIKLKTRDFLKAGFSKSVFY